MNFKEYEERERTYATILFNNYLDTNRYDFSEVGSYSRSDGTVWTGSSFYNIPIRFEVKVRDISKDKYYDHFVEEKKIEEFLNYYNKGYIIYFIMFFQEEDRISSIMYNITHRLNFLKENEVELKYAYEKRYLPITTAEGGRKGNKDFTVLPLRRNSQYDIIIEDINKRINE